MTKENSVDFDELVFEKRNKFYGAYLLRKKYDEHLLTSLFIGVLLMGSVVAIPYVSAYFSGEPVKEVVVNDPPPTIISVDLFPPPSKPKVDLGAPPKTSGGQAATIANRTLVMSDTQADITPVEDMKGLQPSNNTHPGDGTETIGDGTEKGGDCLDCPETGGGGDGPMKSFKPDEAQPKYPGGEQAMYDFLRKNIQYPERAKNIGIEGTVYIQFIVDEYGKIRFAKIARGIGGGCDEEALRVVNLMPRWEPARQAGHP
eukprot:gene4926-6286_t